ncbi:hypothetical protein GGE07_000881 [Sinorhizobium terangae]|uniref:Uncharacterized protein n=1 Tax=Sinorhizobium terangae TaxID=110322 RepID=A0A6N7L8N4_SINTE|nr:hypothetical protein [Sinorhizobium terangae]MBB4184255.1 hypothetical protein [Sinorhizobium terangae]MQX13966.1 hypothetical protein [Sinorhizobium terangae]
MQGTNRIKDVVIDLQVAAARADGLPAAEVRDALLDAADIVRTPKIILDVKEPG